MRKILTYTFFSVFSLISLAGGTEHICSGYHQFSESALITHIKDSALLKYDIRHYGISLEVNDSNTFISGHTDILALALDETDELVFELRSSLSIDSIFVNGAASVDYSHGSDLIRISPELPPEVNQLFKVRIYYHGQGGQNSFYAGISNRLDSQWNTRVTYTLSEPFRALDWFVCKQFLPDKADSADIYITVDEGLMGGSNGILVSIDSLPGNRLRYHWHSGYPIAYYLLSLSVSNYQDYSYYVKPVAIGDSLLVQNFIYNIPEYLDLYKDDIDMTGEMLGLYSNLLTPYPFINEKYGHCLAPMGGGMEHQTMTTLSGFNFTLVAHELTHQWFGDNVTCASWQDIWINEGFASYGEYLALEKLKSSEDAGIWMKQAQDWAMTEPHGSVFIPEKDAGNVSRIFSRALSYKKGACLLHMIRYELNNDQTFFRTLSNFQRAYSDSVATGKDFLEVLNETSAENYDWFFEQWYYGKGYPLFNVSWQQNDDTLAVEIRQEGSSEETPFFRTHLDLRFRFENGTDTIVRTKITQSITKLILVPGIPVTDVEVDPENRVLQQSGVIRKYPQNIYLSVNPNPFDNKLNIIFLNGDARREILLTDINGRILEKHSSTSSSMTMDTQNLSQGLYLIQVKEGQESYSAKVIRQ